MNVSKEKAKENLLDSKKILMVISAFVTPNGDGLGSSFGLAGILKENYKKEVKIISAFPIPKRFYFLPGSDWCELQDPTKVELDNYNLAVVCDSGTSSLVTNQKKS